MPQQSTRTARIEARIYVHHTGQPIEAIEAKMERDSYLTAMEARDFGLVDEVVESRPTSAADSSSG